MGCNPTAADQRARENKVFSNTDATNWPGEDGAIRHQAKRRSVDGQAA
jgi:hypothetical protein